MTEMQTVAPEDLAESSEMDGLFFNVPEGHTISAAIIVYKAKETGKFIIAFDCAKMEAQYPEDAKAVIGIATEYLAAKLAV